MAADVPTLDLTVRKTPRSFTLGISGVLGPDAPPALRQTLEEIEAERYANVTLDLRSVERIDISAVRELAAHATRVLVRDLSIRTVPPLASLYVDALISTARDASAARRELFEIHRATVLGPDPDLHGEVTPAILDPERRLRDAARAIETAVVDLKTDPNLLRSRRDPNARAWRRVALVAAAAGRADRELQACFLELSALAPQISPAADLAVRTLTESLAADEAMGELARERLAGPDGTD
jgi:anti-anti-sigma regulatory factor